MCDFVISVFSVLTTLLIGWQIYNVVNFDSERKRMKVELEKIRQDYVNTVEYLKQEHNDALYGVMGEMAMMHYKGLDIDDFRFINYSLSSAMYGLRSGREIGNSIKMLLEYISNNKLKMSEYHKILVLDIFYQGVKPFCNDENLPLLEKCLIEIETSLE